jgi:Xaa-Pro dipeptidase
MISAERYRERQRQVFGLLQSSGADCALIVDFEGLRNRSVRYLCGQPNDAALFLFARGESLLVAWDLSMAERMATADRLLPYETYHRALGEAIRQVFGGSGVRRGELSSALPYPLVQELSSELPQVQLSCRRGGIDSQLAEMRAVKDAQEMKLIRQACRITDELLGELPGFLVGDRPRRRNGSGRGRPVSEAELALFLEGEARARGAEGMGFETLAASPGRSFGIHCYPAFTTETFLGEGFSILDFGVSYGGYTSDVTVTFCGGPLGGPRQAMKEAVEEAYGLAMSLVRPGVPAPAIGQQVAASLRRRGYPLPHGLGHGIGLDAHEAPSFRDVPGEPEGGRPLQPGMVLAIEPAAYDPQHGGIRLENDAVCTEGGVEWLTSSRIMITEG